MGAHLIHLGMVVAQLADMASFVVAVARIRIEHEANGVAVALYRLGGIDAVIVGKGIVILAVIAWLVVAAQRYPRVLFFLGGGRATSIGLLGFITNTWSLAIVGG